MTTNPTAPQDGGEKLAPCPFCNGEGMSGTAIEGVHFAGCGDPDCVAHMLAYGFASVDFALAAWNTRATPDLAAVRDEALEEAATEARNTLDALRRGHRVDITATIERLDAALQQKGPSNG